ncbi:MAG: YggS family pyridoxal phosphate-dependent enzyme [Candidatus Omnitrophica bacterium]|nr:YggS family pyridoxal phosphate-dependent enzyme [Candidatus Omnitrophota bacterium]
MRSLRDVKERIGRACQRVGRNPEEVLLILVTKGVEPKRIREAYEFGMRHFGENRVQEFIEKKQHLPSDIRWHFIGSLQANKVKFLIGQVVLIHSCDRLDLAQEIQKQAQKHNRAVEVLLQVNTSQEQTKHGFSPDKVEEGVSEISAFDRIRIRGLMTIGPNTAEESQIRGSFRALRLLRDDLKFKFPDVDWRYLSMGMSSDFEIAIEEGANLLRIGTAVFGPRNKM